MKILTKKKTLFLISKFWIKIFWTRRGIFLSLKKLLRREKDFKYMNMTIFDMKMAIFGGRTT